MEDTEIFVCPSNGCIGCEHSEPHEFDSCESICEGGGDNNCPACIKNDK